MPCKRCGTEVPKGRRVCDLCRGIAHREAVARLERKPEGLLRKRYRCAKIRVRKNRWPPLAFSPDEFVDWALADKKFTSIFEEWVASGYDKDLSPSLDREDSTVPYVMDNLRWLPWKENHRKGYTEDREAGTVTRQYEDVPLSQELTDEELEHLPY